MTNDGLEKDDISNDVPISATSTSCLRCVFATFDGKTQIGCIAGQLDKFKESDVEVLEVFNETDGEFFVISNKLCSYYRPKKVVEELLDDISPEDLLVNIKAKLLIPYQAIVFFRSDDSLEELHERLVELQDQEVKPKIVTVIDRSHSKSPREGKIMKLFQNNFKFDYWRIHKASAIDQEDNELVDICYDNTKKYTFFFYTIFETSKPIPMKFSEEMHTSIQNKMMSFTVLTPNEDGVGGTALKVAHGKYGGNSFGIPLETKLKHYDDSVHLIKKVEDLCPSLRKS